LDRFELLVCRERTVVKKPIYEEITLQLSQTEFIVSLCTVWEGYATGERQVVNLESKAIVLVISLRTLALTDSVECCFYEWPAGSSSELAQNFLGSAPRYYLERFSVTPVPRGRA